MKKIVLMAMLLTGIAGKSIAQTNNAKTPPDKTFDWPADFARHTFLIELGKGNKLQLELGASEDVELFKNIDSVLTVFLKDIRPLMDSLLDPVASRTVDYIYEASDIKKIRIRVKAPQSSSFAIDARGASLLKLDQDTINFLGKRSVVNKYTLRRAFTSTQYFRFSFFLNNLNDLETYIHTGLEDKLALVRNEAREKWAGSHASGMYLKNDPAITAKNRHGFQASDDDFAYFNATVAVQNYKSYFVPSFSLGAGLVITTKGFFKRDVHFSWDPHFLFARTADNKIRTFRNDFLSLEYSQGAIQDKNALKNGAMLFTMSFSYLVHRSGDYFDEHTMRIGAGRLSLFEGKTRIEPMCYFHDLFKNVTPGIKWIQSF